VAIHDIVKDFVLTPIVFDAEVTTAVSYCVGSTEGEGTLLS